MRVQLPDIESQFPSFLMEESMNLIRETTEYTIQDKEKGTYQVISTQPAFHVEIAIQPDNIASCVCHCITYKRTKQCKHALAAIIMLRDSRLKRRNVKAGQLHQTAMVEDAVSKIHAAELKRFVRQYAKSHAAFRIELLAETLYLTKKPDFMALLMDITPIDKQGQLKVNRNNLKLLRGTLTVLHRQAQQLIKDKTLTGAFQILEATMLHLQRLMVKFPLYQPQLASDYKVALRLLEVLCQQEMAPRLKDAVIRFAMELSAREGHSFFKGHPPVLRMVESFILDVKSRDAAFQLAEQKIKKDTTQQPQWSGLLLHWIRLWKKSLASQKWIAAVQVHLPEILLTSYQQMDYDDVLFILPLVKYDKVPGPLLKNMLQAGLRSAKSIGQPEWIQQLQADLSLLFFDRDAFQPMQQSDPAKAREIITQLEMRHTPDSNLEANIFILDAWLDFGDMDRLFDRLTDTGNMEMMLEYAPPLLATHREALITQLARHIQATREAYGGVQARQRLSTIFSHLKSIDLYSPVIDLVKQMEGKKQTEGTLSTIIKGFVFDLDGVIVDTAVHHFQSWKRLMRELGVVIAEDDDHHTRGASRMESLEYLLNKYDLIFSLEEKEALAATKNQYYLEAIAQITPSDLLPGALEFLKASRKDGLLLALGSASKNARGVLEKLNIADLFDAILDGNDAKESKPHPEIFTKASEALGLDPSHVIVFEDASKGVQAAVAAGCHVVGIGDPMTLRDADIVIADLQHATPASIIERIA